MARFVDLDDDGGSQAQQQPLPRHRTAVMVVGGGWNGINGATKLLRQNGDDAAETEKQRKREKTSPAVHNAVTEAFQCYPIVFAIVSSIDLNTLDALARTSRLIHNGLIQCRASLLAATLRCSNERVPVDPDRTLRYHARASNWHYMVEDGRSYSGKSGSCARDMVGECRRCAEVVCRNCVIKPPVPAALRERHRRLCITCARAPIAKVALRFLADAALPLKSDAVQRAVCKCDSEGVWLCQPCGRSIRNADHEYKRIWRWRNQYGEVLGGLGTGIGDGDRGVICGREDACIAAREREHEIDCDAEDARDTPAAGIHGNDDNGNGNGNGGSLFPTNSTIESLTDEIRHERTPSPQLGPGYERHEIEGIGGIVKRKLVRMVRVGACVPEWEDEKGGLSNSGKALAREVSGSARSWCGWCWRVIPGIKDNIAEVACSSK